MSEQAQRLEVTPPMFRNAPFTFIFYLLLIPVFGLGIILLLIWFVKARTTRMVIDGEDLLYEKGVLSKERAQLRTCLLYTSPSPRDVEESRMPSSA